jgi:hypothetical protein
MNDKLWRLCPWWMHMRRHINRPESELDRRQSWNSVLQDWYGFQELYLNQQFRSSLSSAQEFSYNVLEAWWSAAYCGPRLPRAAQLYIEDQMNREYVKDPTQKDELTSTTSTLNSLSLYHSTCFCVFLSEFHPRAWEPYKSHQTLMNLQSHWFDASVQAVIQQAAYAVLHPSVEDRERQNIYPKLLLNDTLFDNDLSDAPKPYYLWDTSAQQTVLVSSLPYCPQYVCISHTWGRWRTGSNASMAGVPWLVPENSLYDVRDLPEQFTRLCLKYIWFDLFCIPKDNS